MYSNDEYWSENSQWHSISHPWRKLWGFLCAHHGKKSIVLTRMDCLDCINYTCCFSSNVRCQRQTFVCPQGDTECLYAPLSYSVNFITFPSEIRVPADLFTMRGPLSPYRRLEFELQLKDAHDPRTGVTRVGRDFFHLRTVAPNEVVVQLLRQIEGPQDIELQLDMKIYSKEFSRNNGGQEMFFGTAVAKILIFVTGSDW